MRGLGRRARTTTPAAPPDAADTAAPTVTTTDLEPTAEAKAIRAARAAEKAEAARRRAAAVTAAVSRVQLDGAAWKTYRFGDRAWQQDAWRLYDITGQLRFVANWIGSSVSNCRMYVAEVGDDGEAGAEVDDDDAITALAAGPLGTGQAKAEALRLLGLCLFVPGECYIIAEAGGGDGGDDLWWVVTGRQISRTGDQIQIKRPPNLGGGKMTYRDGVDLIIRCWTPHPNDTTEPDSPTRSAIPDLREIEVLRKREFAELDSRLAGAGILGIPDGIDLPRSADDPPGVLGFQAMLQRAMAASLRDRATAEAMVPIMVTGPAEALKEIRHITFWSELSEQILPLRKAAVENLALDLDIPPEVLLGLGSTNHWSAWAISDEAIATQIKPILNRIASALTLGYLTPALEALGRDPAAYCYAFDTSRLTSRPNREADAMNNHDRMLISDDAARAAGAWTEEDAPDDDERARRIAEKIVMSSPQVGLADPGIRSLLGLPELPPPPAPVAPPPPELPPGGEADEEEQEELPESLPEKPTKPPAERAPSGLSIASRFAVRRALALAGGRLIPHRQRDRYPDTARHQLHTHYGPVRDPIRVAELLTGAWVDLPDVVADLGVDPGELVELLTEFTVALLSRGIAYDDRLIDDLLSTSAVVDRLRRKRVAA